MPLTNPPRKIAPLDPLYVIYPAPAQPAPRLGIAPQMRDERLGANKYMVAVMILWARSVPVVNGLGRSSENVTVLPHRTSDPHACCHGSEATLFRRARIRCRARPPVRATDATVLV